jgi:predicted dehydrogenase
MLFENGCVGHAHMDISYVEKQKHLIEIHGNKGTIMLKNNSNNFVDNFELTINTLKGTRTIKHKKIHNLSNDEPGDPRVKIIKPIAERFINWCNTSIGAKPDFQDGLRVQKLIEMARISNSKFYKHG